MKLSKELVRIHAHLCGDGGVYVYKTSENDRINRASIAYFNNNISLIKSFREDMFKVFNVKMTFLERKNRLQVQSIRIARALLALSKYGSREWRIPKIIKRSRRELKLEWIKAFCLDEGYLPSDRNWIRIKCMNFKGLNDLKDMLNSLNIKSTLTGPNCDASYYLNIKKMAELECFTKKKMRK